MIGVLGLQGDYAAHTRMLAAAGTRSTVVKRAEQLADINGLIIPGGESTTLLKLLDFGKLWQPLKEFAAASKPIMGTCAGMILLAGEVLNPPQRCLGLIDVTVERNGYGRQLDSFEDLGTFSINNRRQDLGMIFIRAPRLVRIGPRAESLAYCRGECVMARQNNIVVASFHPELTDDTTIHQYFSGLVENSSG